MSLGLAVILLSILMMAVSYALGSLSFAIIFTHSFAHTDIRKHGSGNAGMTNVLRTAGKMPAFLTFICDFTKGAISVFLGKYGAIYLLHFLTTENFENTINPLYFAYIGGIFCLLGHIYPVFFDFRGGKGVASLAGIMLVIDIRVMLIAIGIFAAIVLITRIVSLASIFAAISLPFSAYFLYVKNVDYSYSMFGLSQRAAITIMAACFALIIIVMHSPNIKRLIKGEEKRFSLKNRHRN